MYTLNVLESRDEAVGAPASLRNTSPSPLCQVPPTPLFPRKKKERKFITKPPCFPSEGQYTMRTCKSKLNSII